MAVFKPFKAIRPQKKFAEEVSCLPYDVMNRQEAKNIVAQNDKSFLRVIRSEIDFEDSVNPYSNEVYMRARSNLINMVRKGILIQDSVPKYYIYKEIMNGHAQTGLVGCASIDDYINGVIKKHELTRTEKEVDRINHFYCCKAHTEPVFLAYQKKDEIKAIIKKWSESYYPLYEFTSDDEITHIVWDIFDSKIIRSIEKLFSTIPHLYIADGHHRSASSVKVGVKRRQENTDQGENAESNYFLTVAFSDSELFVMDYNRVVKDLNGLSTVEFLGKINEKFDVSECGIGTRYKPDKKHTFGMYIDKKWYKLRVKEGVFDIGNIIGRLDVSILQNNILGPILGIKNPRTDSRIDFIGGIRGLEELERRVGLDMKVAFSMFPTSMEEIMQIADEGKVMPPKSTWFEPKLRSGLFIHSFNEDNYKNGGQ